MQIEQAIYGGHDVGGYRFLAQSPGFSAAWLAEAERLCTGFGERPAGVRCPLAVFARPFGSRHVAVVQVADQGFDDAGRPGALAFRVLVVPQKLYADLGGDPFLIADTFPPHWEARGELPVLTWEAGPPPPRLVANVRKILDVDHTRTATLLGGVQILVDGGRLVFVRDAPDPDIIRDLWALLPYSTRTELWPATFAFGNRHGFSVLATPDTAGPDFEHYVPEHSAGDYPEGRYEYAVQKAADDSNQAELDSLFARRSRRQTMKLALGLLVFFALVALIMRAPIGPDAPRREPGPKVENKGKTVPNLPPAEDFAPLMEAERQQLAGRLGELAGQLGVELPAGDSEDTLRHAVVELDRQVDAKLGKRRPVRDPGKLDTFGPVQRRLRALLWKHGDKEYAEPGLNAVELVERLDKRLADAGLIPGDGGR